MKRKFDIAAVTNALKERVGVLGIGATGEATGEGLRQRTTLYPHLDPSTQKLSKSIMAIYSAPQFAMLPVITLLSVYAFTFYESLGGSTSVATFFVALARCLDVLLTPYMSILSDHCRSKYGRRLPFCFIGTFFYVFFLLMVCSPPTSLTPSELTGWFGCSYIGLFLSYTFLSIPYDALGPELTDLHDDRSMLYWTSGMFEASGTIIGIVLPGLLAVTVNMDALTFDCSNKSCYDASGVGESCLADPRTDKVTYFTLFDPATYAATDACNTFRGVKYANPAELFVEKNCYSNNNEDTVANNCLSSFCNCINNCDNLCTNNSRRLAFRWVAGIFSLWIMTSMLIMVSKIKERKKSLQQVNFIPQPVLPSIISVFRNRAFTTLLPAWVLESVAFNLISCMMVYFVRYVIKPEFQGSSVESKSGINCNSGYPIKGEESDSWQCKSNLIVGAIITSMLVMAFLSCPIWLFLVKKYGKRDVWIGWSASYAFCMILFFFVGEGDVILAIAFGFVAGIPLGAKFISDAILADIIEYDEFLTGQRNEATYTMFKSFIPKLCAIPAGSLPIALLNSIGHKQPVFGHIQEQPAAVKGYCITMTVALPTILCLLALVVKTRYPFRTRQSVDSIREGIGKQIEGRAAQDPITRLNYISPRLDSDDQILVHKLDHFPSLIDAECFKICLTNKRLDVIFEILFARVREHLSMTFFSLICCAVGTVLTYDMIESPDLFIVPTFCVIFLGVFLLAFTFQILRFYAVRDIKFHTSLITKDLLQKVISYRRRIAVINDIQTFRVFRLLASNEPIPQYIERKIRKLQRAYQKWSAKFFHGIEEEEEEEEEDDDDDEVGAQNGQISNAFDEGDDDVEEEAEVKVVKEEEVIEMGIFSHSHVKKVDEEAVMIELYKKSYEIWFEINNVGYFVELLVPDNRSKVTNTDITVWDHELYSFLIEMGKVNLYFQKLRIKKLQNKGKNNNVKSKKSNRRDDDDSDFDDDEFEDQFS